MPTPRRRAAVLRDLQAASSPDGDLVVPKVINAAPSLEKAEMYGIDDPRPASKRFMALAGRIIIETIPQWLAAGGMLALIFGGCCSNVSVHFAPTTMISFAFLALLLFLHVPLR
jgi:UDP-xylose/UDP-N-acetylglucosamine transporter B4